MKVFGNPCMWCYSTDKTAILLSINGIVVIFRLWFWSTLFVPFNITTNKCMPISLTKIYKAFPFKTEGTIQTLFATVVLSPWKGKYCNNLRISFLQV